MEWLLQTILSAVISSVIVVSFLSIIVNKMQLSLELRLNGIKRIHPYGKNVKSLEKTMKKSRTIKVLGFSALGFIHTNRKILTAHVANGGDLEFLLASSETDFVKDAFEMEGRSKDDFSLSIKQSLTLISAIEHDAIKLSENKNNKCGKIEVKRYQTEIRNQLILCIDADQYISAWMSVLIPPLPAVECSMIEYSNVDDCVSYYNTIWSRY